MRFVVIKASIDGYSHTSVDTVPGMLREICHYKGWSSLADLHDTIRRWATIARPGDVFYAPGSAIVVSPPDRFHREEDECQDCGHSGLEYGGIEAVESGNIEQRISCPKCKRRWVDVFTLSGSR